jgi:hypothetical protein
MTLEYGNEDALLKIRFLNGNPGSKSGKDTNPRQGKQIRKNVFL